MSGEFGLLQFELPTTTERCVPTLLNPKPSPALPIEKQSELRTMWKDQQRSHELDIFINNHKQCAQFACKLIDSPGIERFIAASLANGAKTLDDLIALNKTFARPAQPVQIATCFWLLSVIFW